MKISSTLSTLVFLPALTLAVTVINDPQTYKPCTLDPTVCPDDQACFKYFCYPKKASAGEPLKSCSKNSKCPGYKQKPRTEKCLKEGRNGVCVSVEDYEMCEAHEECKDRGGKCCNDYCCNVEYFDALLKTACPEGDEDCEGIKETMVQQEKTSLDCTTDALCEEKKNGHMCCEDNSLLKDIVLSDPIENWGGSKRCCMSATKLRKLSDVDEKLTDGDYEKIGQEIGKLAPAKQVENCEELETSIAEKIQTCKTLIDEKTSKLETQKQEQAAIEAATAAASQVETAAENANEQMKLAETANIAAEAAKTTAETSQDLDEIKTANETAHAEANKAQEAAGKAAEEVITAKTALNTTEIEAAKAVSMKDDADKVIAAATTSAQNAADSATKAEGHADKAKAAAATAKTAADKAVTEGINPKDPEVKDPPITNPDPLPTITPDNSIIAATLKPVDESKEVISESNPEIPDTVVKPVVDDAPKPEPKSNTGAQNDPKENNSGNAVTMSTIGIISCLIFYSLINQLEVPASLF